jgi:two-component system sensor histidine kinase/response regulator
MLVLSVNAIVNYFINLPISALLSATIVIAVGVIYYYSRIKRKLDACIIIFGISSNLAFIINYYVNSGINGPSLQIFILSFFLIIAIAPKKQYLYWIAQNVITVIVLLMLDFHNPDLVPSSYLTKRDRFIDFGYSYAAIVALILMVIVYIRNSHLTQQRMLEKEAAELESANGTKNKLLSIVAHDLRSPLSSIQGYLEILADYKLDENEKRGIELDLLEKTKNTGDMLSNLLSWTMNQMGGVSVNLQQVSLSKSLKVILNLQQATAHDKGIELINEIDEAACVIADNNMVQLVVRNLLTNAIKFTAPGGEVIIGTKIHDDECYLTIRDTGIGITEEKKNSVFAITSKSTYGTKNEKGVGLGLVLCKEFTELQQGKIWYESIAGKGTTFFVSLKKCDHWKTEVNRNDKDLFDTHSV